MNGLKYSIYICQNIVPVRLRLSPTPSLSFCSIFLLCHILDDKNLQSHSPNLKILSYRLPSLITCTKMINQIDLIYPHQQEESLTMPASKNHITHNMKRVSPSWLNLSTNPNADQNKVIIRFP